VHDEAPRRFVFISISASAASLFECQPKKYSGVQIELKLYATLYKKSNCAFVGRTCEPTPLSLKLDKGILASASGQSKMLLMVSENENLNDLQLAVDIHVHDSEDKNPYLHQGYIIVDLILPFVKDQSGAI